MLTPDDLAQIRAIVREEVANPTSIVAPPFTPPPTGIQARVDDTIPAGDAGVYVEEVGGRLPTPQPGEAAGIFGYAMRCSRILSHLLGDLAFEKYLYNSAGSLQYMESALGATGDQATWPAAVGKWAKQLHGATGDTSYMQGVVR